MTPARVIWIIFVISLLFSSTSTSKLYNIAAEVEEKEKRETADNSGPEDNYGFGVDIFDSFSSPRSSGYDTLYDLYDDNNADEKEGTKM